MSQRVNSIELPVTRGNRCPNCEQETQQPSPYWAGWDTKPHEDPFDCIRHLSSRLRDTQNDVRSIRRNLQGIEDERLDY